MALASRPGETTGAEPTHTLLSAAELLAWRREMLMVKGETPASPADLDWLLDLAGGLRWARLQSLWLHPDASVSLARPLRDLQDLWLRHLRCGEPLQYLVGVCPWRDLELAVSPAVLIPRQETELLVELALQLAPQAPRQRPLHWADLGTGSGCLAVALARGLAASEGFAVDACPEALNQAGANMEACLSAVVLPPCSRAQHSGVAAADLQESTVGGLSSRVRLRQGDWWQAIEPWWGRLDLVVSNPPYIPTAVLAELEPVVRDHEPRLALDGGSDGLQAIRAIVSGAPAALAPGGVLLLEHHHDQSQAVLALMEQAGLQDCRAHQDLEGVLRFASARLPGVPPPASPVSGAAEEPRA